MRAAVKITLGAGCPGAGIYGDGAVAQFGFKLAVNWY